LTDPMKKPRISSKSQSTLEYAVLVVVIIGGLVAMQYYLTQSHQGRLRKAADETGESFDADKTASLVNAAYNIYSSTTTTSIDSGGVSNITSSSSFGESQTLKKTETTR
jgi:hypothetical protein